MITPCTVYKLYEIWLGGPLNFITHFISVYIRDIIFLGTLSYNVLPILCSLALSSDEYLICIELSFLAESWRHVLGLDLLLGHVVLVLVEEMLVLNLSRDT